MRRLLAPVLLVLVIGAACTGSDSEVPDRGAVPISGPMPALEGETLTGEPLGPAETSGKVTVVNFWATWCGPCREEQPVLQAVWERFEDGGEVAMVGVNYRDDAEAAATWLRDFGVTYPSLEDPAGELGDDWPGFLGLPITYVSDRTGELRFRFYGGVTEEELTDRVAEVLDEPPS